MIYDLIGTIYKPSGVMLTDPEGFEYNEMEAVFGYHVNVIPHEDMSMVEPYTVTPETMSRVFAGRDDTVCLKFTDRDEWLSLNIEEAIEI